MERAECSIEEGLEHKKGKMWKTEDNALENCSEAPKLFKKEAAINTRQSNVVPSLVMPEGANNKGEVPLLESKEKKNVSIVSDDTNNKGEISLLKSEERIDVSTVLADANNKDELLSLDSEERKYVSSVSEDESNNGKAPLMESEERRDFSMTLDSPLTKTSVSSRSRKKLLVLDLNGLLADIVSPPPKDHVADINIARKAIFKRPFCADFLKFCFENFEVGIWSSRTQKNVERITDYLLGDMKYKLIFCWDISLCAKTTISSLENKYKFVVFKELRRLWEKHDPKLPWEREYYNETNTLLLDDSPYKALLNPPHTGVFPYSYNYQAKTDNSLGDGGDLRVYLEKLAEAENVQEYVKKNPFGQEAITETSDSWGFYGELIKKLLS